MPRLLFEKQGRAIWISHLDLMRLFQRAFKRAGLKLTHTQGFNPRPSVSIALPLSVGVESMCELLDFDLDGQMPAPDEICSQLNEALVEGVNVKAVYTGGRKVRDLALLRCLVSLQYNQPVQDEDVAQISDLFAGAQLHVTKKTKNGVQDQDIIPMIRRISVARSNDREIELDALVCCQNPTLNPAQLAAAVTRYLPELAPAFSKCKRLEIYDLQENVFR